MTTSTRLVAGREARDFCFTLTDLAAAPSPSTKRVGKCKRERSAFGHPGSSSTCHLSSACAEAPCEAVMGWCLGCSLPSLLLWCGVWFVSAVVLQREGVGQMAVWGDSESSISLRPQKGGLCA
eukprot:Sspe_Gene.74364::Locus_46028_Transcript_1_2_Confidence_0.800_Length_537::g.74364::m.74364